MGRVRNVGLEGRKRGDYCVAWCKFNFTIMVEDGHGSIIKKTQFCFAVQPCDKALP